MVKSSTNRLQRAAPYATLRLAGLSARRQPPARRNPMSQLNRTSLQALVATVGVLVVTSFGVAFAASGQAWHALPAGTSTSESAGVDDSQDPSADPSESVSVDPSQDPSDGPSDEPSDSTDP